MTIPIKEESPFSQQEVMTSLERILASEEFVESAQLCRFLRYTVENRLAGNAEQLKESSIGVTVFRRGADYDPKSDPIVRVQARRLRARLDAYYGSKGSRDTLRIVLPKGGYAPIFEAPPIQVTMPETLVPASPLEFRDSQQLQRHRRDKLLWMVGGVVLVAVIAGFAYRLARPEPLPSQFWSSIFQEGHSTLIVPSDTGLAMLQDLVHKAIPLHDYVTGDYRARYEGNSKLAASGAIRRWRISILSLILPGARKQCAQGPSPDSRGMSEWRISRRQILSYSARSI